jgi:7-cyano-7-deazaguanine reductase
MATLKQLGKQAAIAASPDKAEIEKVKNPHKGEAYCVRFICPEFTSICPITGQPDFAHLVIDYVPKDFLLESKSLKLCTVSIALRIMKEIKPVWLRIGGYWYPRGGIPIDIFYQSGDAPKGVWIPVQDVPAYRGR